jgi:tetratricopeptide (TPR) repeat protein
LKNNFVGKLKYHIIIIGLLLSATLFANKAKEDSLMSRLNVVHDSLKAQVYNELALEVVNNSADKAIELANKALEFATRFENVKEIMYAYDGIGCAYYSKGNLNEALKNYQKSLDISKEIKVKKQTAFVLNRIGVVYKQLGKYQEAIECYQNSYNIYEELGATLQMGMALSNIGNIYYYFGLDFNKALDYYEQGAKLFDEAGNRNYSAFLLNNIGLIYKEKKENGKALDYFRKSLKIFEELQVKSGIAQVQNNLCLIYLDGNNYELALKNANSAYKAFKELGDKANMAMALRSMGTVYSKWGQYDIALNNFFEAINILKEIKMKKEVLDAYKEVSNVYSLMGDYENAYTNFQKYSDLKDSVLSEDYLKQIQEMEAKYETDKKEKEIQLQKAEISKKELQNKQQKYIIIIVIVVLVIIVLFLALLFKQFSDKKKANVLLAQQNDEIKSQRDQIFQQKKEITDSIHYASRIQRAVLPPEKILDDNEFEHFILYKPRDIVSGDFYWMNQRDNKLIVAAADCTGHGVPGAFMSMLGMAFLNEIFTRGEYDNAAQILDQLRLQVVSSLHQTGKMEETKDGMDISLCLFDKDINKMHFAGAFNSLYLVRGGELIEAQADRMPIGVHEKANVSFTNHVLDIQKGDSLYILSDGYIDQFGGENGKKFMTKRFKQLLLDIQQKNMEEQKSFLDTILTQWRGEYDQIDDIMVIGIRI